MIDDEIHVNIYGRCEISLVREIVKLGFGACGSWSSMLLSW
jgi:hypothetical protein